MTGYDQHPDYGSPYPGHFRFALWIVAIFDVARVVA